MTAHLRRKGLHVSIGTVDRLMRDEGLCGVLRGKNHRTTIPGKDGKRASDLVDRGFTAPCPNRVWVADFTYCRTWSGFVYVSFIIDVFSRKIVGWHVVTTRPTELVTVPLRMALWNRRHEGIEIFEGLLHHSGAGAQYVSLKISPRTHARRDLGFDWKCRRRLRLSVCSCRIASRFGRPDQCGLTLPMIDPSGVFALICQPPGRARSKRCHAGRV